MNQKINSPKTESSTPIDQWEDVIGVTETGDTLLKRVPVDRIETPCSVGMVASGSNGDGPGRVIQVTPSHCLIQYENGEVDAIPWHNVSIECVVPAGMPLARPYCTAHEEKRNNVKLYPPKL